MPLDGGGHVDLADAVTDARLEILLASTAASMEDQGEVDGLVDLGQPGDVQLGRVHVLAVQGPDRDGEGIYAGGPYETYRFIRVGEHIGGVYAGQTYFPELGLHSDSRRLCYPGHFT